MFIHLFKWSQGFCLNFCLSLFLFFDGCVMFIDLPMTNHPCIPEVNPAGSCRIIFKVCCRTWFTGILFGQFALGVKVEKEAYIFLPTPRETQQEKPCPVRGLVVFLGLNQLNFLSYFCFLCIRTLRLDTHNWWHVPTHCLSSSHPVISVEQTPPFLLYLWRRDGCSRVPTLFATSQVHNFPGTGGGRKTNRDDYLGTCQSYFNCCLPSLYQFYKLAHLMGR